MNRVEQMKQIQHEALELFTKKNSDYGDTLIDLHNYAAMALMLLYES